MQHLSLMAQYFKELNGKDIVESDKGFVTYMFLSDGCYIQDAYVLPKYRNQGLLKQFVNKIEEIAKEKGYKRIYTTVRPSANASTASLGVAVGLGFKLKFSDNDAIIFEKDLR